MSTNKAIYKYDSLGRLTEVQFSNGSLVSYSYDELGNRLAAVEVPGMTPPTPTLPTVASLPKHQAGDFKNAQMVALLSDGTIAGWGDTTTGVLANGVSAASSAVAQRLTFDPNTTMPPSTETIVDWAFTNASIYVVFSNGWVYSAGTNNYGQLGHGDTTDRNQLKRIEYFVSNSISVAKVWACGSYQGPGGDGCVYFQSSTYQMYGCGANTAGNLGNASTPTTNVSTPAPCAGIGTSPYVLDVAIAVSYTSFSTFMLMSDGTVMVAGLNGSGQLGTNTTTNVTGSFTHALKTGGTNLTGISAISANGGYSGGFAGNALALDSSGNMWTTGYNAHGELALNSTTNAKIFTQVTALTGVSEARLGGGFFGCGYALTSTGSFYTWGYNAGNNLFLNNSTSPVKVPTAAAYTPGTVSKVFFPKSNNLPGADVQLIILTTGGQLAFAGANNGQIGIDNAVNPGAYSYIPTPRQILDGTENIADVFVHGTGASQRLLVLTDLGNLFASGSNIKSVCTGGVSSDTMVANTAWTKISFMP